MRCNFLAFLAYWAGNLAAIGFVIGLFVLFVGAGVSIVNCSAVDLALCGVGAAIIIVALVILVLSFISGLIWLIAVMEYRRSCP